MSEIVAPSSVPEPTNSTLLKKNSINDVTATFGKESVTVNPNSIKDAEMSTVTVAESTFVKVGSGVQLAAKSPDGELGRIRLIVDPATKQRLLVAPPIKDGITSEIVTLTIAAVGGAAVGSELCYNQLFTLLVTDNDGKVQSLNNNPQGLPDGIGLQERGMKGEMTFMFVKPKDNSKIQFNDNNLILTCQDSHRTRKNFNNVMTLVKKGKGSGHGGYFTTCKKGPSISFTIARPNEVPFPRLSYRDIVDNNNADAETADEVNSATKTEQQRPRDSFSKAVETPLPPTPHESFSNAAPLAYIPPEITPTAPGTASSTSTSVRSVPRISTPVIPTPLPVDSTLRTNSTRSASFSGAAIVESKVSDDVLQPPGKSTEALTSKQESGDDGGEVVHVHGNSPALQASDRFANLPLKATSPTTNLKSVLATASQQQESSKDDDKDDVPVAACTPCAQCSVQ